MIKYRRTKVRKILRLHSQGISSRVIAVSLTCSRNTVRSAPGRAEEPDARAASGKYAGPGAGTGIIRKTAVKPEM
jgi:hypothetical protein